MNNNIYGEEEKRVLKELKEQEIIDWNKDIRLRLGEILYFLEGLDLKLEVEGFLSNETLEELNKVSFEIDSILKDERTEEEIKKDYNFQLIQDITVLCSLYTIQPFNKDMFQNRKGRVVEFLKEII